MTLFDTVEVTPVDVVPVGPQPDAAAAPASDPAITATDDVRRIRMVVAYDGTDFHGFAAQHDVVTVGGTLAAAVEQVVGQPIVMTCAGRTDAGVHAWGQVVSFDLPAASADVASLARVQLSVNRLCAPSIVVREVAAVADDFDARFSAVARTYRYTVLQTPVPDPFRARTVWHVPEPLDLRAMQLACDPFIGEHDFSSFCRAAQRSDGSPAPLTRRVTSATWVDCGDGTVQFRVTASAFCHQMVRALVGTLVEVGRGKRRAGEMMGILLACDRQAAGQLAPPIGLCLWHVDYPDTGHRSTRR
jgi:tRNA pseudouridine38-40 synthase